MDIRDEILKKVRKEYPSISAFADKIDTSRNHFRLVFVTKERPLVPQLLEKINSALESDFKLQK